MLCSTLLQASLWDPTLINRLIQQSRTSDVCVILLGKLVIWRLKGLFGFMVVRVFTFLVFVFSHEEPSLYQMLWTCTAVFQGSSFVY